MTSKELAKIAYNALDDKKGVRYNQQYRSDSNRC